MRFDQSYNYVTRQLTGCFATSASTTTTAAKRKAAAKKHKKHKKRRKHRLRARRISRPPRRNTGFTG